VTVELLRDLAALALGARDIPDHGAEFVGDHLDARLGDVLTGQRRAEDRPDPAREIAHHVDVVARRSDSRRTCQQETAHLSRFGARPISRQVFAAELSRLVNSPHTPSAWKAAALLESDRT